jgi:hypothetical protein
MDLVCVICRDLYDQPVLARDGFAYCRACIVRWVGSSSCWTSPRSNERYEGRPTLRGDVERACLAREARLAELRAKSAREALTAVLEQLCCGRPLAPPAECRRLLRDLTDLNPHEELELVFGAGSLRKLSAESLRQLCDLDRRCRLVPLLEMSVVTALLQEARRRCQEGGGGAGARELLLRLRKHFLWRASFTDAVEVPASRVSQEGLSGVYFRDWQQQKAGRLTFLKSAFPQARLSVPLESNRERGTAEETLFTHLALLSGEESAAFESECSEELPARDALWGARRGVPPFPDSRGGDSDEDDLVTRAPQCVRTMQRGLLFLPRHFGYHSCRPDEAHREAALREKSLTDDVLIDAPTTVPAAEAAESRKRAHATAFQ